jgi:hypothetical protein
MTKRTAALEQGARLKLWGWRGADDRGGGRSTGRRASDKRTKAGKPGGNDRVKRAQEGRRRAEARAARAEGKLNQLGGRLAALESGGKAPLTGDTKTPK